MRNLARHFPRSPAADLNNMRLERNLVEPELRAQRNGGEAMLLKPKFKPTASTTIATEKTHGAPTPHADVTALLTPAATAAILGVTAKALERWRSVGSGPVFVRLSAKSIRYREADVAAFVECRLRSNTAGGQPGPA